MRTGRGPMTPWINFVIQCIYLAAYVHQTKAGVCWTSIDSRGLCRRAFAFNMTKTECCNITSLSTISWTPGSQDRSLFYWTFLASGVDKCHRCHTSCDSVRCHADHVCRMKSGIPQCVCRPQCDMALKSLGKVCGTDNRKYKNYCSLLRHNCVKAGQKVEVAYYGKCRQSCRRVRCEDGKTCMEDQYGRPHCITCSMTCNEPYIDHPYNHICGQDGRTYKNSCELKAAICRNGKTIRTAYYGSCLANATCDSVGCRDFSHCVVNPSTHNPICIDCDHKCISSVHSPVCGTDGNTYQNYCHLTNTRCTKNIFIDTKKNGPCRKNSRSIADGAGEDVPLSVKQKQRLRHRRQKMRQRNRKRRRLQRRMNAKKNRKFKNRNISNSNTRHDRNFSSEHRKKRIRN